MAWYAAHAIVYFELTDGPQDGFEVYENVGGAHPQTWYKSFNWNLEADAPLTFDTLFRPDTRPLDVIFPIVQADVARQLGVDAPIAPADGLDPAKYQQFALTDEELIFFFGQGEIMPGAGGALQATVPRQAIASTLALEPPRVTP